MKAFIECSAGSNVKNRYDERTLRVRSAHTLQDRYPFPYGFIMDRKGGDGECVDCFVLSDEAYSPGDSLECEPVAMFSLKENDELEYKVFVVPVGSRRAATVPDYERAAAFIRMIFSVFKDIVIEIGPLLSKEETGAYLDSLARG